MKKKTQIIGVIVLIILTSPLIAKGAKEDYTSYTEVDPNNVLTITTNKIEFAGVDMDVSTYVYKDYGADFFDGNFTQTFDAVLAGSSQSGGTVFVWLLANDLNDQHNLQTGGKNYLGIYFSKSSGSNYTALDEGDSGSYHEVSTNLALDTRYYVTVQRNLASSTYGTLEARFYTDETRTTLASAISLELHSSVKKFRYAYGINNYNGGSTGNSATGDISNLDLGLGGTPPPTEIIGLTMDFPEILMVVFGTFILCYIIEKGGNKVIDGVKKSYEYRIK